LREERGEKHSTLPRAEKEEGVAGYTRTSGSHFDSLLKLLPVLPQGTREV